MTGNFQFGGVSVRQVLNAGAAQSRLGGATLDERVREAMSAAGQVYLDVEELHDQVGQRLAEITRNEAACVVAGTAAGLMVASAALLVGCDADAAARWPRSSQARRPVAVWREHLSGRLAGTEARQDNDYVNSVFMAGARIRTIDSPQDVRADDVALLWFPNVFRDDNLDELRRAVDAAHHLGVPVVVDAADQIPPLAQLWTLTRECGADLAIFSGGKGLGGPTSTGLIVGRAPLIRACRVNGSTEHCVGRIAKVGREELVGLLVAVQVAMSADQDTQFAAWSQVVERWRGRLADEPVASLSTTPYGHCGQRIPRLIVALRSGSQACRDRVIADLWEGNPRINVLPAPTTAMALSPQLLNEAQADLVGEEVASRLADHRRCGAGCMFPPRHDSVTSATPALP